MPVTREGVLGTAQSKTSGTSLAISGSVACDVGDLILIAFASDVGGTSYTASATGVTTQSAVVEGSVASTNTRALVIKLVVTVAGTLTQVSVSWTTAVTAKAGVCAVYGGAKPEALNRGWFNSSDSVAIPYYVGGSSDRKLVTAGCLFFGACAREEASPSTLGAPDTSWWVELSQVGVLGTTGNPAASNMTCLCDDMVPVVSYDGANTHDVTRQSGSAASSATAAVLYEPRVPFAEVNYTGRPDLSTFRRAMIVVPRDTSVPAGASALIAQALTATATTTAAFTNQVGKLVTATATSTASIAKSIGKTITATATSTASIVKSVGKPLSATVTSTATLVAAQIKAVALTATSTTTATIVKSVGKIVTATTAVTSATMVRSVGKLVTATATSTASAIKQTTKTLTAPVTLGPGGVGNVVNLTTGNTSSSGAVGTTASVASVSNSVILLAVHAYASSGSAPPGTPTITDGLGGLTWTLVSSVDVDASGADRSSIYLFRAKVTSGSTGTITITFSGTPPIGRMAWVVDSLTGTDTGGVNGANAIVQTATANGTTGNDLTATLLPFAAPSNIAYGVFGVESTTVVTAIPVNGFSVLGAANGQGGGFNVSAHSVAHQAGDWDPQGRWNGGQPYFFSGGIGVELSSPGNAGGGGAFLDYAWSTIAPVMQPILIAMKRGIGPFIPPQQPPIISVTTQLFNQALTATSVATAVIQNQVGKLLSGTATSTASILKSVGKPISATATTTATIARSVGKLVTATAAVTSAAMTRSVGKLLSATSTTTAFFTNQIGKVLSATSVVTGFLDYTWSTIAPVMRAVPILLRRGIGPLIPQQLAPPFSPVVSIQQALTATVTTTATIANSIGKGLVATATTTASMLRSVGKTLSATATSTASILAQKTKLVALTATATTTAVLQRSVGKAISATATTSASIAKGVGKLLSASSVTSATIGVVKQIGGLVGLVFKMFDRSTPTGTMTDSSPDSPVFDESRSSGETFSSSPSSSTFDPPSSEE